MWSPFYNTCGALKTGGGCRASIAPAWIRRVDAQRRERVNRPIFFLFLDKSRKLSKIVSVLQSASVERFNVSRMRDFSAYHPYFHSHTSSFICPVVQLDHHLVYKKNTLDFMLDSGIFGQQNQPGCVSLTFLPDCQSGITAVVHLNFIIWPCTVVKCSAQ